MRITGYATSILLLAALISTHGAGQDAKSHGATEERAMFATKWMPSKGGIGMVNKSLYIVVKSAKGDRNELVVKPTEETEQRWKGQSVGKAEVVVFYQGKVWSGAQGLPDNFDLSKAVVVSFENDKARFFDFQAMDGGYYERISD
jgi:hypothetical protein